MESSSQKTRVGEEDRRKTTKNALSPPNEFGLYFLSNILTNQGRLTVMTTLSFSILKAILYYCNLFTYNYM